MAIITLNVLADRFNSLAVAPNAWLLYLPTSDNIQKGDTLMVRLVDSLGNYLGQYRTGICNKTSTEQFIVYAKGTQCYYFNQLSMPTQIFTAALFKQNNNATLTGTTAETVVSSFLIPAGTMNANDVLRVLSMVSKPSTANLVSIRFRLNATAVIAGSTLVGFLQDTTGIAGEQAMIRNIVFKNSLSSQVVTAVSSSLASDESVANNAGITTSAVNFALDQYFIITGQLALGTETLTIRNTYGSIIR